MSERQPWDALDAFIAAAPEVATPTDVDLFRIGSMWRSKRTKRLRVIVDVNGDDVMTRFENGANYYMVTKDFLVSLYYPIG